MSSGEKVYALQSEIMQLGINFVEGTADQLGADNYRNIRAYFEANEYGEAISQIDCLVSSISLDPGKLSILARIRELAAEVRRQYGA